MNRWEPEPNAHYQRRVGKTAEEAGELVAVLARVAIQGLDAIDPSSGKANRLRLMEEMADVYAQIGCNYRTILTKEEREEFARRVEKKTMQMDQWEAHYE